jgi:GNAT superfamily N-acetyltransferase
METAEAMEDNIVEHAARLHRGLAGARLLVEDDIVIADSGLDDDTFNVVVRTRFRPVTVQRRIAAVADQLRGTDRPFAWCIGPASTPPDLSERLSAAGVPLTGRETAMRLQPAGFRPPPAVPGLEIRSVSGAAGLADFAAVVAANWDPPAGTVWRVLAGGRGLASGHLVGYADGRPVCTALVVEAAGVSGIYMVCTLLPYRGRGYGTAISAAAVQAAQSPLVVLQASAQGASIYHRLGFESCGDFVEHAVRP